MKYLCSGEKKFRLRSLMIFCTAFLLLSAVCPSIAMANYQSSLFSTVHDGQIVTYNSGSASHFASPSVVRLADNRLLVVFDLELELATNAANGGAADGVSFTASKLARKFSFGGSDNPPNILNIAPHTYTYAIDGVLRTFSAFEIVTEDALSPTVTLSYDPAFEEEDSFVFAVPSQQSLLSGFPAVSPAPLDAALTKIEIGDALLGVDSRIIFDDADPQITDQAYACFEVVLSDDIPKTTITFTPSDNTTLWTTDFGAPPNGIGETTNEIDLNPGVNKATITLGTGESAIRYTIFIIRGANSAPALKNLNLITMIKATQGQGPVVPYVPGEELAIPLTQGQLAYHTNFQSTVLGVKVAPEADAGVSVYVNGVLLQGDTSEVIELSIDTVNKITIGLVDAEDHTTTYSLYITRGNEAILSGLKLTKIDESEQGAGASPYIEVPIRHVNSDENGYIQDGERDASGWQQYVADANRPGSFAGVEFYLEPTFNADTRVFVSNVKKTTLDPADEVVAGEDGVYRSKPFVMNYRGEELTLYLTMFRREPGGTDEWIMSDSAVAVSVVTEPVKSKLTKITVTDGYTSEDLLVLSGDELLVSTQNSITTSQFAKFIHIEIAKEGSDLLLTPVNFQGKPVGGSGFRADVKFSAYGEEKELIIETVDRQTGDAKSYKLNVTQGHPPFVILGMSPDAVFQQPNPSMLILDMNGLPREGVYDMETRRPIHTVKVPSLPSRTDADGNTALTVDWTICPPSADLDVDFHLIEYERSGNWRMENIRRNADSSGGTLDVVLQNKKDAPYCFRTYSDKTCVRLHNFGLRALLSKRGIGELDDYYGDFAMVTPDFAEITIEVLNQSEVIIKSEKDRYPEDKRLPIIDFKLWGVSYAEDRDNKRIGLQIGRTYKIPVVYSVVTTYGDYREYVRKHPDIGERYPYVFAPGDTAPIPVILEDLRSRNVPGYSPNMMDDRPLEFSHDKIKFSIAHENPDLTYVK
ncbi:cadherin-like beta sandwich domain-containing protein, partial [Synergistaceae bacterium OttesenSCG-928-D05]|nr:cadherin-like beta sandwich domain-containing protein [Synergistaceae bacterium OttesenSCG-928-D05]